jgi:hypothetical protein
MGYPWDMNQCCVSEIPFLNASSVSLPLRWGRVRVGVEINP